MVVSAPGKSHFHKGESCQNNPVWANSWIGSFAERRKGGGINREQVTVQKASNMCLVTGLINTRMSNCSSSNLFEQYLIFTLAFFPPHFLISPSHF